MSRSLLLIVFNDLKYDARVKRQINILRSEYDLSVVCYDSDPIENVKLILIDKPTLTLFRKAMIVLYSLLRIHSAVFKLLYPVDSFREKVKDTYDLYVVNDIEALPMPFYLEQDPKILLDAHEYSPRHFEDKRSWRLIFQPVILDICSKYLTRVRKMTTVCDSLAVEYKKNFDVDPAVITNAPEYNELDPVQVEPDSIRIVYHGGINRSRKIENMIEMMQFLPERYSLDLILVKPASTSAATDSYVDWIVEMAEQSPNVNVLPPYNPDEVVKETNKYDIGVFLLEPINFNYTFALPNKLFEYIQARLAVFVGPSIEMEKLVDKYNCGKVAPDFLPESMARVIKETPSSELMKFKENSHKASLLENAEKNKEILLGLLNEIR